MVVIRKLFPDMRMFYRVVSSKYMNVRSVFRSTYGP